MHRRARVWFRSAGVALTSRRRWPTALIAVACVACVALPADAFQFEGNEYAVAGAIPGDQVWPAVSLKPSGGFVVWQDNYTDGTGSGLSARRLDATFSPTLSSFRVNAQGVGNQEHARVAMLPNGGAAFVWQGGVAGRTRIWARFLSASNTWVTGDVLVNTFTNHFQVYPALACLKDGNVVVAWGSYGQEATTNAYQGLFAQRLSPTGQKLGGEFPVNAFTLYNQRTPAVAALAGGGFVVVWVSEQQRFENSVDVMGRLFDANGSPVSSEFRINTDNNVCANPTVAAATDGGFVVVWAERDRLNRNNGWDIWLRPFTAGGGGGAVRRVNTHLYGDQFLPTVTASGTDLLVAWTSLGQDGSEEGIFARFVNMDGFALSDEMRINTVTASKQMHPAVAPNGAGRFLVVWTSFGGGPNSFDLKAQRLVSTQQPLVAPAAPFVIALDMRRLMVTWPEITGLNVARYEIYANGAASPTAVVASNLWTLGNLMPGSTHTFRLAYVLEDERRSPLSPPGSGTTWGYDDNFDGLPDDWQALYWGTNPALWPSPLADSDGDGMSNRDEFLAGTDPTNPNSVLRVRLQPTAQGLYLNWNTQLGLMYQVQTASVLPHWHNLGPPRFAAGHVDSMYVGGSDVGFFRVIRLR